MPKADTTFAEPPTATVGLSFVISNKYTHNLQPFGKHAITDADIARKEFYRGSSYTTNLHLNKFANQVTSDL